jgi:CRP/FNR family transcriptional regulator, nitrogen oxide reductase regulator
MEFTPADLRRVTVFEQASDDDLLLILKNSIVRSVEEGAYFFFQGDPAEYLYILTAGQIKLLQSNAGGQQVNMRTVYPWQVFGALGAVREEASYPATAQALEDSTALAISSQILKEMLHTRPYLAMGLMQLMTFYLQEMQDRYRELATERVQQRIARSLLRLASQSGQKADDGIELALSRQDFAEISGTTLYTVSRVLTEWERQGIIASGREHIRIPKPHDLVRIAEGLEE